ncbi:serine/threonine-protein kinase PknD [Mycobacterium intracellulare]|uniref:serine/threonine-protein kinase PknD n=1 Tax=Mycobacterium intracellulare TaxID=1767 RepID=UPI0006CA6B9D|nr:serine/threonine-protein kinase PknD [Mycobacterium intracellulare]KPN46985.1 serine/threonine protein kinase [Mycobacterium intracellulare subsp. chimaera]
MGESEPGWRVGSRFGPYRLMRLLGRGGMGEVYEAEDMRKRRVVALKLISPQFSGNPMFRARMQREADAAGRLTEPHVVPIHDYGEIDGQLYVEMRLIDGTALSTLLKYSGPLSPPRAVAIIRQIAAALDAAHAIGVTHRDVKPENILITGDDFAYLVDFGIARAATDPGLTQAGTAVGTCNYMAPERFTGTQVTYRADIYALTCVLAECLTGSPPYLGDQISVMSAHLHQAVPRPSAVRPGIPVALDQVIARGMAKNPEERYRSAGELAAAATDTLTVSEHDQAATVLRQSEEEIRPGRAVEQGPPGAEAWTEARAWSRMSNPPAGQPAWMSPAAGGDSWLSQPGTQSSVRPAGPPDFRKPPETRYKRKLRILVGAAALLLIAALGVSGYLVTRGPHPPTAASGQTVLPFTGLDFRFSPGAVALDTAGNVYVTNKSMYGRVVKLAAGSNRPTVLSFTGLYEPTGVAVDTAGAVYVTDFNHRVVKLAAGSKTQTELPFTGLNYPEGVAVDTPGSVYVVDRGNNRVVKLAAGSNTQSVLPFTGLNNPVGVAVDVAANVYVVDSDNNRVVKLAAGSNTPTDLPVAGLAMPWGVAVDTAGNVYVTDHDNDNAVKLAAGSSTQSVLPFTGLNTPCEMAVDTAGNVYVADRGNNRVVKLAVG